MSLLDSRLKRLFTLVAVTAVSSGCITVRQSVAERMGFDFDYSSQPMPESCQPSVIEEEDCPGCMEYLIDEADRFFSQTIDNINVALQRDKFKTPDEKQRAEASKELLENYLSSIRQERVTNEMLKNLPLQLFVTGRVMNEFKDRKLIRDQAMANIVSLRVMAANLNQALSSAQLTEFSQEFVSALTPSD